MNTIKGIGLVALIVVLTIFMAGKDIFHLNKGGINGENLAPSVYGIIGFGLLFFAYLYLNKKKN